MASEIVQTKYTSGFVKNKIVTSSIWCERSLLKIVQNDLVKEQDKDLISSLVQFHTDFGEYSEIHIKLIRKILVANYINDITKLANGTL